LWISSLLEPDDLMHSFLSFDNPIAPSGQDVFALKDRLEALFLRHGRVLRLDLVRADQGDSRRVMCFLRMSTPEEEQAVVDALGLGRFGGDLVLVLALDGADPLPARWPAARSAAPQPVGWS
jgi:hypothetical protein